MPAMSLRDMAQQAAIRNLSGIQDVAEIPYDLVRPILKCIDNPQQLREIEKNSPHIADRDAELWQAFIMRDIPNWKEKILQPSNPRSWWKVYRKLLREEQKAKEEQEQSLAAALNGLDQKKQEYRTQFVQKVITQPQKQKRYVDGNLNPNVSGWNKEKPPPVLSKATKGKDILAAIRKQVSSAAKQKGTSSAATIRPYIPSVKSQIQRAPEAMIRDHQKPVRTATINTPRTNSPPRVNVFASSKKAPTREERELDKAIKDQAYRREEKGKQGAAVTVVDRGKQFPAAPSGSNQSSTMISALPPTSQSNASPSRTGQPIKRKAPVSVFMPPKKRKV